MLPTWKMGSTIATFGPPKISTYPTRRPTSTPRRGGDLAELLARVAIRLGDRADEPARLCPPRSATAAGFEEIRPVVTALHDPLLGRIWGPRWRPGRSLDRVASRRGTPVPVRRWGRFRFRVLLGHDGRQGVGGGPLGWRRRRGSCWATTAISAGLAAGAAAGMAPCSRSRGPSAAARTT